MANLLLIDNQLLQYIEFSKMLSNYGHAVFPIESDFKRIMGLVKMTLNHRFVYSIRQQAIKELEIYIKEEIKKIDVFILDHKLIGNHQGKNAFYLLEKLREINDFRGIPVIFFSRTPRSHSDVKDIFDVLEKQNCIWVEKGYAGKYIIDEKYFEKFVINKIPELIAAEEFNSLLSKAKLLILDNRFETYLYILNSIIKNAEKEKSFNSKEKDLIKNLPLSNERMTNTQINKLFRYYEHS